MGVTKTEKFNQAQNDMAAMAKALAHPARVAIIQHLIKANACINGDLVNELGLAQATISQHLRELKEIGLIQGTIEGTSVSYCIDPIKWKEVQDTFGALFNGFGSNFDCC
jgi:predicted transcriptional regulator